MVYRPLAQACRLRRGLLEAFAVQGAAHAHHITRLQVSLAFLLAQPDVIPIPRTRHADHTLKNAAAMEIKLSEAVLAALNRTFSAPRCKVPLDM